MDKKRRPLSDMSKEGAFVHTISDKKHWETFCQA